MIESRRGHLWDSIPCFSTSLLKLVLIFYRKVILFCQKNFFSSAKLPFFDIHWHFLISLSLFSGLMVGCARLLPQPGNNPSDCCGLGQISGLRQRANYNVKYMSCHWWAWPHVAPWSSFRVPSLVNKSSIHKNASALNKVFICKPSWINVADFLLPKHPMPI